MLRPKLFDTIKTYTLRQFYSDAMAGTIVGIVALPLAIAFAIASGVSPERGLFTAVIGGLVISLLGGSRVQIGDRVRRLCCRAFSRIRLHPLLEQLEYSLIPADPMGDAGFLGFQFVFVFEIPFMGADEGVLVRILGFPAELSLDLLG